MRLVPDLAWKSPPRSLSSQVSGPHSGEAGGGSDGAGVLGPPCERRMPFQDGPPSVGSERARGSSSSAAIEQALANPASIDEATAQGRALARLAAEAHLFR